MREVGCVDERIQCGAGAACPSAASPMTIPEAPPGMRYSKRFGAASCQREKIPYAGGGGETLAQYATLRSRR